MNTKQIIIKKIKKDGDRLIIYGNNDKYHYITNINAKIKVGDVIEVEDYGINFGYVVK